MENGRNGRLPGRWLLLRGLSREQRHWLEFPAAFTAALPGASTALLDLPGVGLETQRPAPGTIPEIVADLRERWLALQPPLAAPEPPGSPGWGVLGISLGGMVAMDWCARHPSDFQRAVIITSSARDLSPFYHRMRPGALWVALRSAFARDVEARERLVLSKISTNLRSNVGEVATRFAAFAQDRPLSSRVVLRQLAAALRFRAPAALPVPALFLGAGGDRFVHPSCTERLARHLGGELVYHPSAGHELTLDAPEWVAEQVAGWVNGKPKLDLEAIRSMRGFLPGISTEVEREDDRI